MRYYLDTNILVFVLLDQLNEIDNSVIEVLKDYSNLFYISTIAMRELILLYKNGEIKKSKYKTYKDIFHSIEELGYEIKPFTKQHVEIYSELVPETDHKDPTDHMIIAQSISDKIPVISSDKKFKLYEKQGLKLVFNKR